MIDCEIELILTWSKNCVLADMIVRAAQGGNPVIVAPSGATFEITDTKLYLPVVTLSKENYIKLLEQLKSGFKRTIKWNKLTQHLLMLTDYLFFFLFARTNAGDNIDFFSNYYVPNVELKDLNVLINRKIFSTCQ